MVVKSSGTQSTISALFCPLPPPPPPPYNADLFRDMGLIT